MRYFFVVGLILIDTIPGAIDLGLVPKKWRGFLEKGGHIHDEEAFHEGL